jgi:hypothetical protein
VCARERLNIGEMGRYRGEKKEGIDNERGKGEQIEWGREGGRGALVSAQSAFGTEGRRRDR